MCGSALGSEGHSVLEGGQCMLMEPSMAVQGAQLGDKAKVGLRVPPA